MNSNEVGTQRKKRMKDLLDLVLTPKEFESLADLCKRDPQFPTTWQTWNDELKNTLAHQDAGGSRVPLRLYPQAFSAWCSRVGIVPCIDAVRAYAIIHRAPLATARYGAIDVDSRSMGLDV
jgi:hypothetical protein